MMALKILFLVQLGCLYANAESFNYPRSICSLERDSGNCGDSTVVRYYYDSNEKSCLSFNYGDCGNPHAGNANNFVTKELCEKLCVRGEFVTTESQPEKCKLVRDAGPCRGYMPNFYYNSATNECEQFAYGGCGGNENRFYLRTECIETCVHL